MLLLAVDPGVRACGVALFEDEQLVAADWVRTKEEALPKAADALATAVGRWAQRAGSGFPDYVVIERPKVYENREHEVDKDDLISLAIVAGAVWEGLAGFARDGEFVLPREWKGQVPKDVHNARVMKHLEPEERAIVHRVKCTPKQIHNVIDAVGLGLWAVDR